MISPPRTPREKAQRAAIIVPAYLAFVTVLDIYTQPRYVTGIPYGPGWWEYQGALAAAGIIITIVMTAVRRFPAVRPKLRWYATLVVALIAQQVASGSLKGLALIVVGRTPIGLLIAINIVTLVALWGVAVGTRALFRAPAKLTSH